MKYFSIFALLLIAFVALSSASCAGKPRRLSCRGRRDDGHRGRRCSAGSRWYYHSRSRQCRKFHYWGCGGNNNRHCSKSACERLCRRRN